MFLGIAYHSSIAFVPGIGQWYLVQDRSTHWAFATLGAVLHAGRMQVFFVLSGFFAHLVAQRGDWPAFAGDRFRRLLVPLLVAAPVVVLFDVGSQAFAGAHGLMQAAYRGHSDGAMRPLHLWFLEYIVLFSALCWPFRSVGLGALIRLREGWLLPGALLSAGLVLVFGDAAPAFSFVPQVASLLGYGVFFLFGWLLWPARHQLELFKRSAWLLPAGVVLGGWLFSRHLQYEPPAVWLSALTTWAMVIGSLGTALRMTNIVSRRVQWLVQSSYWVYLSHYPVVVAMQLLVAPLEWPVVLKFVLVAATAALVSVGAYALVIRRSFIGRWLTPSLARRDPA